MPARRDTFKYHNCRNTQTFNFATSVQVSVLKKKSDKALRVVNNHYRLKHCFLMEGVVLIRLLTYLIVHEL